MNTQRFSSLLLVTWLATALPHCLVAQTAIKSDAKKIAIQNMVDSQRFVFDAQSVSPMRGGYRNLSSIYDVSISKDSLVSYLPFFGRADNIAYNSTTPALDFTSTRFSYIVSPYKKDGWTIVIKPADRTDINQYLFTVFNNGSASLTVDSNSRDAISFNGYIRKKN